MVVSPLRVQQQYAGTTAVSRCGFVYNGLGVPDLNMAERRKWWVGGRLGVHEAAPRLL